MSTTVTLTGYLGKDRNIRATDEYTYTRLEPTRFEFHHAGEMEHDDLFEEYAEHTARSREYALLSLATHRWEDGQRITIWHRIVAWNVDRLEHMPVRMCRKGDRVRVTGRRTSFTTRDGREIQQIELDRLEILRNKAPEVP